MQHNAQEIYTQSFAAKLSPRKKCQHFSAVKTRILIAPDAKSTEGRFFEKSDKSPLLGFGKSG
jgi:hypothetical protein